MTKYRYTGTDLRRANGERVEKGDVIEPTEAELAGFGDTLEPIEPVDVEPTPDPEPEEAEPEAEPEEEAEEAEVEVVDTGEPFPGYDELTVDELTAELPNTSTDALHDALEYEERTTAKAAIEDELASREE